MTEPATEWLALLGMVFLLGLKHGIDPDHLAVIDGIARQNAKESPRLARASGALFSLGHGLVVTLVAIAVASLATDLKPPAWLEHTGAWVSITFLLALTFANLRAVFTTPVGTVVRVAGLKSHFVARFAGVARVNHPLAIACIGAAFALSFDTMSHAVVFSLAGSSIAGWIFSAALGVAFTVGMMVTDALNGLWISALISRADARAAFASRVMSVGIAGLSFMVAMLGVRKYFAPSVEQLIPETPAVIGLSVIALTGAVFLCALYFKDRQHG